MDITEEQKERIIDLFLGNDLPETPMEKHFLGLFVAGGYPATSEEKVWYQFLIGYLKKYVPRYGESPTDQSEWKLFLDQAVRARETIIERRCLERIASIEDKHRTASLESEKRHKGELSKNHSISGSVIEKKDKEIAHLENRVASLIKLVSSYRSRLGQNTNDDKDELLLGGQTICRACGGDGGVKGGCLKCDGKGWV